MEPVTKNTNANADIALIDPQEKAILSKVARRLIPLVAICYAFNILDRTNISMAALKMQADLSFSDTQFGFGAGMFFIGYFFFEVPSNLILDRVGARKWIARIMFTWGVVSAAMMFVQTPLQFYVMRFLLGVAEAGFYPGMILYMTYWFPTAQRAQAVARFVAVSAIVGVLGSPLSGLLLGLDGMGGLHGWQWLFLLEGVPSCLLGFVVLKYMTDRPEKADWLTESERNWLVRRLANERKHREKSHGISLKQAFTNPLILHFCLLFLLYVVAGYGVSFFLPKILASQTTLSTQVIGFIAAMPGLAGAISMLVNANRSDKTCERRRYVAGGTAVGAVGLSLAALGILLGFHPVLIVAFFILAEAGRGTVQGPFWAMPTSMLTGAAAAGAIAFINSVGNLGGHFGPALMGKLKDETGNYYTGLFVLSGALVGACILALLAKHSPADELAARRNILVDPVGEEVVLTDTPQTEVVTAR